MLAPVLGLLMFGADVGVHVELREDVSLAESQEIAAALSAAITQEIGWPARVTSPEWVACAGSGARETCIREVKAALGVEQVLMLKLFGTSTRVRVVAERFHLSDAAIAVAELDLLRGEDAKRAATAAALALFPGIRRADPKDSVAQGTAIEHTSWVPWVVLAASAAAAGAGAVFGLNSAAGKRELERMPFSGDEYLDRKNALDTQTTTANVLFSTALLGGAAGLVLFLIEA